MATSTEVVKKFFIASVFMWVFPIAIIYGFQHNVFPGKLSKIPLIPANVIKCSIRYRALLRLLYGSSPGMSIRFKAYDIMITEIHFADCAFRYIRYAS